MLCGLVVSGIVMFLVKPGRRRPPVPAMAVAGRVGFGLLWLGFAGLIAGLVLVLKNTRALLPYGERRSQRQHETENEKKSQSMH